MTDVGEHDLEELTKRYGELVRDVDWNDLADIAEPLRELAGLGEPRAMDLLAIHLSDADSHANRAEIIALHEGAHDRGSLTAAGNLSIYYREQGEPELSEAWSRKAEQRG
ncbi:hypothetical protein GCM10009422_02250 [Brevundimonas kwangchunensis]|uniref:Uncharacterized protein n=1 Tax=Brevundimonas kwangchunensis TaxID=322163 RepID=A0ABN1GGE0_9CAUL